MTCRMICVAAWVTLSFMILLATGWLVVILESRLSG